MKRLIRAFSTVLYNILPAQYDALKKVARKFKFRRDFL